MTPDEVRNVLSQLFAGGTALAGLVLVFLGGILTSFDAYPTEDKPAVIRKYRARGIIAFSGFLASLVSAGAGLVGLLRGGSFRWLVIGLIALTASAILLGVIAYLSVREIA